MNKSFSRRQALRLAALSGAVLAAPGILRAQAGYPERPINVVVPFATGGYNDRLARASAPFLQEAIGQPLVVVNRPGAGSLLGHTFFMQQPDDGYSMLCTSAAPYIPLNVLVRKAPFKSDDFHMINLPSNDYTLLATVAGGKITSVEQMIEMLKKDPKSLSIGIQPSSADYINLMLLMDAHKIDRTALRLVTYDGGGPARNATAGGVVDVGLVGGEGFLPLAEKVQPLLVFDDQRIKAWDAPSAAEFAKAGGYEAEFVAGSQRGWVVHATFVTKHPERYQALVKAIETATKNPKAVETLQKQQLATDWFGPEKSNAAYQRTAKLMEQHVDLLKAS